MAAASSSAGPEKENSKNTCLLLGDYFGLLVGEAPIVCLCLDPHAAHTILLEEITEELICVSVWDFMSFAWLRQFICLQSEIKNLSAPLSIVSPPSSQKIYASVIVTCSETKEFIFSTPCHHPFIFFFPFLLVWLSLKDKKLSWARLMHQEIDVACRRSVWYRLKQAECKAKCDGKVRPALHNESQLFAFSLC